MEQQFMNKKISKTCKIYTNSDSTMTAEQKARQLTLTLVGTDQNPTPLIEVLMEMAEWQRERILHNKTFTKQNN